MKIQDQLSKIVSRYGWTVNARKLPIDNDNGAKRLTAIENWLAADERNNQLSIPEDLWITIEIPYERWKGRLSSENDAKAILSVLFETREDFAAGFADPATELCNRIDTHGILTRCGWVYVEAGEHVVGMDRPVRVWIGKKAGRKPALEGAAVSAVLLSLIGKPSDNEPDLTTESSSKGKARQPKLVAKKAAAVADSKLEFIDIDCIQPSADNDRKTFDKEKLQELANSIKVNGVLQPILLRPLMEAGRIHATKFEIVAGERRWRAARLAGLQTIPAQIGERDGLSISVARLDENLKRVDLSPIEKAQALKRLMEEHGLTQKEVGEAVGVQQGQVSNMLRLLNLPDSLQKLVADGKIAPTFIRAILPYCDLPAVMDEVAKTFVRRLEKPNEENERIEMRDVEQWIRNAVVNHSRPMKYQAHWSEYSNPNPKDRHFSKVSDENLKLLAPRKIDVMNEWEGKERTFNVKLFDELNKTPLANRREKHKAYKAERGHGVGSEKGAKKTQSPFESQYQVEHALESRMSELLADAIESIKPSTNRQKLHAVVLALAISSGESIIDVITSPKTDWRKRACEAATKLDCLPAQCDRLLQAAVVKDLRHDSRLQCSSAIALAKMLGVDLLAAWTPNDELRKCLTDHGRQLLAEAGHGVPDFLLPFFGVEKKPAKLKKNRSEAA